jgi:hypothetical protein
MQTGLRRGPRNLFRLGEQVRPRDLADETRMILADVLLRVLPELIVVVTPDDMATDARDLLHAPIVRPKSWRT